MALRWVFFVSLFMISQGQSNVAFSSNSTRSSNKLFEFIFQKYREENAKCVNIIIEPNMEKLSLDFETLNTQKLALQIFNYHDVHHGQLRDASLFCHFYIIAIRSKKDVSNFVEEHRLEMKLNTGKLTILTSSPDSHDLLHDSYLRHAPFVLIVEMSSGFKDGKYPVYLPLIEQNTRAYERDFWNGTNFVINGFNIFKDVVHDMKGRRLNVVAFHFPPYLLFNRYPNGTVYHTGYEYNLIKVIAKAIHFEIGSISLPDDNKFWGGVKFDSNGSAIPTGIVGNLYEYKADIGIANIYVSLERYEVVAFSIPYRFDYGIFVTRNPLPLPQWQAIIFPFGQKLWLMLIITLLICITFVNIYGIYHKDTFKRIDDSTFDLIHIVLDQSTSLTNSNMKQIFRVFLGIYIINIVVLTLSYKGSLISVLTVPHVPPPIDTVKDLLEKSTVPMGGIGLSLINHGRNSPNENVRKLIGDDYIKFDKAIDAFKACSEGKNDLIFSMLSAEFNILTDYTNEFGEPQLHILAEKYKGFMSSFGFPMINLYGREISRRIMQLFEGGIIRKIRRETMEKGVKKSLSAQSEETQKPLNLDSVQGAFLVWFLIVLISITVFIFENAIKRLTKKK